MVSVISVLRIGDKCTHCGEHTAWGSGNFVNRIPSYADADQASEWLSYWDMYDAVDGYMCASCQVGGE